MTIARQLGDMPFLLNTNVSSNTVSFFTSSTERMRIDQYGNIGIGVSTTPYSLGGRTVLALNGTNESLFSLMAGGSSKGYLRTDGTSVILQAETGDALLYTATTGAIVFGTRGISRIRIDSSGNVGIGTSTPQGNLHVMGNLWISNNAAFIGGVRFPDGTFQTTAASGSSGNITVVNTGTNATFYPAFFEATSGSLAPRVDTGFTFNPTTDYLTTGAFIPTSASAPVSGLFLPAANTVAFSSTSSERMRIDSTGNIGIGSTSPTTKLDVSGVVKDDKGGDVRTLVLNSQSSAYQLQATDHGKMISITTGGITVPAGVFLAGQNVTLYNNSASSQTITTTAVTCYLGGTATTGARTLAQRGIATLVCVAANTFVISGAGLS